jgi:hypothetical protein
LSAGTVAITRKLVILIMLANTLIGADRLRENDNAPACAWHRLRTYAFVRPLRSILPSRSLKVGAAARSGPRRRPGQGWRACAPAAGRVLDGCGHGGFVAALGASCAGKPLDGHHRRYADNDGMRRRRWNTYAPYIGHARPSPLSPRHPYTRPRAKPLAM